MNKYRVLLTRARQGMIIYIPHGDDTENLLDLRDKIRLCGSLLFAETDFKEFDVENKVWVGFDEFADLSVAVT